MLPEKELANAVRFFPFVADACELSGIRLHSIGLPWLVLGIGSRETGWGTNRLYRDIDGVEDNDPGDGTGDHGNGLGLMQIDKRWHKAFAESGDWKDPEKSIRYAVLKVLVPNWRTFGRWYPESLPEDRIRMMLASYNCGAGNVRKAVRAGLDFDFYTTPGPGSKIGDYGWDVTRRALLYQKHFNAADLRTLVPRPPDPLT